MLELVYSIDTDISIQKKNIYIYILKGWIDEYTLLAFLMLGRSINLQCSVKD